MLVAIELFLLLAGLRTDSVPELGSRASQHNPGGLDCDPWSLIFGAGLFTQVLSLPLLVHYRCRTLQGMYRGRSLAQHISLKVAVFGLILGINALDLLGAALGLLPSVSFSALILMACCRPQAPWRSDSRRNIFPT